MTNEEVMQILTDMGLHEGGMDNWVANNAWWKFANVVAQHERDKWMERTAILIRGEREACAKVCEETDDGTPYNLAEECANAIRARGQA